MKKYCLLVLIVAITISCNYKDKGDICERLFPFSTSDTCMIWKFNPTTKYIISYKEEYFIWKKYGVTIDNNIEGDLTRTDSCFYEKSRQYYVNKLGLGKLKRIDKEIDSLVNLTRNYGSLFYYDSLLYDAYREKNTKIAKVIDEDLYYKLSDSLSKTFKSSMDSFLEYWYVIDTLGNLKEVELINCNCSDDIEKKIFKTFKSIKWEPAVYHGKKVEYRNQNSVFVKGITGNRGIE